MAERMKIKSDVLVNMQKGMTQRNATKLLPYMYIYTQPPLLSLSLSVSLTWALFLTLSLTYTLTTHTFDYTPLPPLPFFVCPFNPPPTQNPSYEGKNER